jgi:predicted O-methyltransferase YrrM
MTAADAPDLEHFLADLFADPPLVHDRPDGSRTHVWHTEPACYRLMAGLVSRGARTLETGCGVSTAMFAGLGTEHTAVFASQEEADALLSWCARRGVSTDRLTLRLQFSSVALPTLTSPFDLFFIDGAHSFPAPILDWFYGGQLLVKGGVLVVDDAQLPAVALLLEFLDADPRWEPVAGDDKWRAYRRLSEGSLVEEWVRQSFWRSPRRPSLGERALGRARRTFGRRSLPEIQLPSP